MLVTFKRVRSRDLLIMYILTLVFRGFGFYKRIFDEGFNRD
jgi:hypothetical protein